MDDLSSEHHEKLFTDIYSYDKGIYKKVQLIIESSECQKLEKKAVELGFALSVLDDVIPDKKMPAVKRIKSFMNPFYTQSEYSTREEYLQYLKYAYGFMMSPLEEPPGRLLGFFFPKYRNSWSPSNDSAVELLKKFYVEVNLIRELSESEWTDIASSKNPEAKLAKTLYGAEFKPDFLKFIKKIPWILARDVYSSPGLDLMYWTAPGQKMPQKPFGIGDSFLTNLAKVSSESKAYVLLSATQDSTDAEERVRLKNENQILQLIEKEGTAHLDTFVGISKIERDFVIHQHIAIWNNPGYERYKKASIMKRIAYMKPPRYLCVFREQALPLEIAFIERSFR
jgi:hypothetical protein